MCQNKTIPFRHRTFERGTLLFEEISKVKLDRQQSADYNIYINNILP